MAKKFILITLFFIILTAIFTYPFIFRMNNSIAGWQSTDEPFAALWNSWWYKYAFHRHLDDSHYSVIAAPFEVDTGGRTAYSLWDILYKWSRQFKNSFIDNLSWDF